MTSLAKNQIFRLTWISQTLFQMATSLVEFTLIYLVGEYGDSDVAIALVLFAYKFPAMVMSLVSGVLVDRYDRRLVLFWATMVRAIGAVITLFFFDHLTAIVLFALVFSLAGHLFKTAEGALLPEIVSKKNLTRAAGLFNMTEHGTTMIGLVITFPLIGFFASSQFWQFNEVLSVLALAAIMFSLAALSLMRTKNIPAKLHGKTTVSLGRGGFSREEVGVVWQRTRQELKDGWEYIKNCLICKRMIVHLIVVNVVILTVMAIGRAFGEEFFGVHSMTEVGRLVILPTIAGFVTAIVFLPRIQRSVKKLVLIDLGVLLAGVVFVLMGALKYLFPEFGDAGMTRVFSLAMMCIVGFAAVCGLIPAYVLLQERTENELRGRTFGFLFSSITAASSMPLLGMGYIVSRHGVVPVLLAAGGLAVLYAGYLLGFSERSSKTSVPLEEP